MSSKSRSTCSILCSRSSAAASTTCSSKLELLASSSVARNACTKVCGKWLINPTVSTNIAAHLGTRSEEHTSELQSRGHLVCRLLLEKKKKTKRLMAKTHRE